MSDEVNSEKNLDVKSKNLDLADVTMEYIGQYQLDWEYQHRPVASPLEVDELASSIARAYERFRKVIDWKEENLLRRGAIERILKRRLVSELYGISILPNLNAEEMAEPMVLELMRSGYFNKGAIARHQVTEVKHILQKYITILNRSHLSNQKTDQHIKNKMQFYTWMLELAACEIEETLSPAFKENALINLMTNVLFKRSRIIPREKISEMDQLILLYVAVQRALYNFDDPIISYNVIKIRYPFWVKEDEESVQEVIQRIEEIYHQIATDVDNPYSKDFAKLANKYDAAYRIIGDILDEINSSPQMVAQTLRDENTVMEMVERIYMKRKASLKGRLFRSAIYSTLSIFVAGVFSFIIFEGPVARLAGREFSLLSLFVDLLIPSAIMFVLVIIIRPPADKNLRVVKNEVKKILYKQEEEDSYTVELDRKKNPILNSIFLVVSFICGMAAMYFVFWLFEIGNVPWTSMYIDTVNVAMVVGAAMVIKQKSKEITIEDRGDVMEFLTELFSVPMARIGQWFNNKWKQYNVFSALMTALIDTPFSALITVVEDWRNFLKEKSSEIR
jgi:hypothetical protein